MTIVGSAINIIKFQLMTFHIWQRLLVEHPSVTREEISFLEVAVTKFFPKGSGGTYSGLGKPGGLCHNYSTLPLQRESSH